MTKPVPSTPELIESSRRRIQHLVNIAQGIRFPYDPGIEDLRKRHTMYVRNLFTAYVSKFAELSTAMMDAIEERNYLVYALSGRALIETTALLRYYITEEYPPLFRSGKPSDQQLTRLLEVDEQHLRGNNFDWRSFLFENYSKLRESAVLRLKKKSPPQPPGPRQQRIGVCIESWAKEEPLVKVIYELFCDLVHPNVGSSFLVASVKEFVFYFTPFAGNPVGQQIVDQSFPLLLAITQNQFGDYLSRLFATAWPDDTLVQAQNAMRPN